MVTLLKSSRTSETFCVWVHLYSLWRSPPRVPYVIEHVTSRYTIRSLWTGGRRVARVAGQLPPRAGCPPRRRELSPGDVHSADRHHPRDQSRAGRTRRAGPAVGRDAPAGHRPRGRYRDRSGRAEITLDSHVVPTLLHTPIALNCRRHDHVLFASHHPVDRLEAPQAAVEIERAVVDEPTSPVPREYTLGPCKQIRADAAPGVGC